MINFVRYVTRSAFSFLYRDELLRFIVKNIQLNDVILFSNINNFKLSKQSIISSIDSQCGSGLVCPFSTSELSIISNRIFESSEKFDVEFLSSNKVSNIVILDYTDLVPNLLKTLVCDFSVKTNILGLTEMVEITELKELIEVVKNYKNDGMNDKQIMLILMLQNQYHRKVIDVVLSSYYLKKEIKLKEFYVLDEVSKLWSKDST